MTRFLSCDWGTSILRVRLVDTDSVNLAILAEENTANGIAAIFNLWKETKAEDPQERLFFYLRILAEHIEKIAERTGSSLDGIPVIISGMASSSIGMMNLPYRLLPFATDGTDAITAYIDRSDNFKHPVLLISGVRSDNDVMRGEETQLAGCISCVDDIEGDSIFIFPGTHSKHITVQGKQVTGIKTYMTGEFFDLLSKKSILQTGIEMHLDIQSPGYLQCFIQGVTEALHVNLLQAAFHVRTNDLFGLMTKKENFNYLSGLLTGTELKELLHIKPARLYVCAGTGLKDYYETALQALGLAESVRILPVYLAEEAVIKGQFKIFNQFKR